MNYRLRNKFSTDPKYALDEILKDRGVDDIYHFKHPTKSVELNPYLLDNIELAADTLLKHLRANSRILFIVDCD